MIASITDTLNLEDFLPAYSGIEIDKKDPLFAFYSDRVPDGYTREFPISTFLKKEFNDLRLPAVEPEFIPSTGAGGVAKFKPLGQQSFMARFMSPITPYNIMLVFHEVGTGKACLSAVVSELALTQFLREEKTGTKRETLILNKNKTLQNNAMKEIVDKCTNGKYIPSRTDFKTGEVISDETFVRRMNALLGENYVFDTFEVFAARLAELDDTFIKEVYSGRVVILDEVHNISAQYKKTTDKKKKTDERKGDERKGDDRKESEKPPVDIYYQFHRFLHLIENCKVLLMTATPIRDKKKEIAALFNLALPLDKQFNVDTFDIDYFDEGIFKESMKKKFKEQIRGLVSYVRVTAGNVRKIPQGEVIKQYLNGSGMKKVPLKEVLMSELQTKTYKKAFIKDGIKLNLIQNQDEEDIDEILAGNKKSLYTNSRQASMFVTPDGKFGEDTESWLQISDQELANRKTSILSEEEKQAIREIKKKERETKRAKREEEQIRIKELKELGKYNGKDKKKSRYDEIARPVEYYLTKAGEKLKKYLGTDHKEMLENLSRISIKFSGVIEQIIDYPKEKAFIYSNLVTESGTELFAAILELFGFEHVRLPTRGEKIDIEKFKNPKGKKQFLLITGTFPSSSQVTALVKGIYNNPKNKYGDYIHCIISSKIVAEGISFFHTRQFHDLTPGWNETEISQAEGRVIRVDSHVELPPEERYIKTFRWCAMPDDKGFPSIDFEMFKVSEDKDFVNKQIERLMKESAVDCALNARRNMRPQLDLQNSRECDYDNCIYYCDNIPSSWYLDDIINPENSEEHVEMPKMIEDSYNLYYANEQLEIIKEKVKVLFSGRFSYNYIDLIEELPETSELVLIRALKELIDQSTPILNKYGIQSYLRESLNLYYLVDSYDFNSGPLLYLLSWYNMNPILKENISFENWVNIYEYEYLQEKLDKISDPDVLEELLEMDNGIVYLGRTFRNFNPIIQEQLLESFVLAENSKLKKNEKLRTLFLELYRKSITNIDNLTISTLLQDNLDLLRCNTKGKKEWSDCDEKQKELLESKSTSFTESLGDALEHYGYYGIDDPEKVLKIVTNIKGTTDARKVGKGGQVCGKGAKYSASKIITLMLYLGEKAEERGDLAPTNITELKSSDIKEIEKNTTVANVKNLLDKISQENKDKDKKGDKKKNKEEDIYDFDKVLKTTDKQLKEFSQEKLKRWYSILRYGKSKILCPSLKVWFKERNMLK